VTEDLLASLRAGWFPWPTSDNARQARQFSVDEPEPMLEVPGTYPAIAAAAMRMQRVLTLHSSIARLLWIRLVRKGFSAGHRQPIAPR